MKVINAGSVKKPLYCNTVSDGMDTVGKILSEVRFGGDAAVMKYTEQFDRIKPDRLEISCSRIKGAYNDVDREFISALEKARENIAFFAKRQLSQYADFVIDRNGMKLGQRVVPLGRVGCYVPGGRYPLPSTALMTIVPAKVAGVGEIIVCSPKISAATIVAADMAGADRIFSIGGVQAIGAMAYGTESVPKVDKIVGPGNRYVTAAKKEVYGEVGIDFLAGPSEILIISDETGRPDFMAADLLAQAEHDPEARVTLITTSKKIADDVNRQLEIQLPKLATGEIAAASLKNGNIIIAESLSQAVEISNILAPEHLELVVKNPQSLVQKLLNYGSLFVGKYSAEVFADYCSGINHTLPTGGAARYTGGLSVRDFIKILTYQEIREKAVAGLVEVAAKLSQTEGLYAHKKSAEIRRLK